MVVPVHYPDFLFTEYSDEFLVCIVLLFTIPAKLCIYLSSDSALHLLNCSEKMHAFVFQTVFEMQNPTVVFRYQEAQGESTLLCLSGSNTIEN